MVLTIYGTQSHDADDYWVMRNNRLLEQPTYLSRDSNFSQFRLVDSLETPGVYTYTVQYGYNSTHLSNKTPAFVYDFPGLSRSGLISLDLREESFVEVTVATPENELAKQVIIERKVGSQGNVLALKTLSRSQGQSVFTYVDTNWVSLDTVLYYRSTSLDAVTEKWLEPTPWDSIRIHQKTWKYLPEVASRIRGEEIFFLIQNPFGKSAKTFYRLYRNTRESSEGKTLVDSLSGFEIDNNASLSASAIDSGTFYFWVEASDGLGRNSPRSVPIRVEFNGLPFGPEIQSLQVRPATIQLGLDLDSRITSVILHRTQDTLASLTLVDTISISDLRSGTYWYDVPPSAGIWFYRLVALSDGKPSNPGYWIQTGYFKPSQQVNSMKATISYQGLGEVEATVDRVSNATHILYRSAYPDGKDSVAVDTLGPSETISVLRDKPKKGTWYYWVYRFDEPSYSPFLVSRSQTEKVVYPDQPIGPRIISLELYGSGIDVNLGADPSATAFVTERSFEKSNEWVAIDTLYNSLILKVFDHPPKNGMWSYRVRCILPNLTLSDPGPVMQTKETWNYHLTYSENLITEIANRGIEVEVTLTTSAAYGFLLRRASTNNFEASTPVDTAPIGDADQRMTDIPSKGLWYYWVERLVGKNENLNSAYRSASMKIDFTGVPEISSVTQIGTTIQIRFPRLDIADSLEIWKSSGKPDDLASYSRMAIRAGNESLRSVTDLFSSDTPTGFYHYRLKLRHGGTLSDFGAVKTLYYEVM